MSTYQKQDFDVAERLWTCQILVWCIVVPKRYWHGFQYIFEWGSTNFYLCLGVYFKVLLSLGEKLMVLLLKEPVEQSSTNHHF